MGRFFADHSSSSSDAENSDTTRDTSIESSDYDTDASDASHDSCHTRPNGTGNQFRKSNGRRSSVDGEEDDSDTDSDDERPVKGMSKLNVSGKPSGAPLKPAGVHARFIDSSDDEEDEADGRTGVDRWKKREPVGKKDDVSGKKEDLGAKKRAVSLKKAADADGEGPVIVDEAMIVRQRLLSQWGDIDAENAEERFEATMAVRGKKTTSRPSQIAYLGLLMETAAALPDSMPLQFRIQCGLVTCLFDGLLVAASAHTQLPAHAQTQASASQSMMAQGGGQQGSGHSQSILVTWRSIAGHLHQLWALADSLPKDESRLRALATATHKLDDEWHRALQQLSDQVNLSGGTFAASATSLLPPAVQADYISRMADEVLLVSLLRKLADTLVGVDRLVILCRILEHLYDKRPAMLPSFTSALPSSPLNKTCSIGKISSIGIVDALLQEVLRDAPGPLLVRAVLYGAHHLALLDDYEGARALLQTYSVSLFSHLPVGQRFLDSLHSSDAADNDKIHNDTESKVESKLLPTLSAGETVLATRTLTRVALAAFVTQHIDAAHLILHDFYTGTAPPAHLQQRQRELLGQNHMSHGNHANWTFDSFQDAALGNSEEADRIALPRRLGTTVPWHLFIPIDILDAAYLIATLTVTAPADLLSPAYPASRFFRRFMSQYDRTCAWHGTPETTKDYMYRAFLPFVALAQHTFSTTLYQEPLSHARHAGTGAVSSTPFVSADAIPPLDWQSCVDLLGNIKAWQWLSPESSVTRKEAVSSTKDASKTNLYDSLTNYMRSTALTYYFACHARYLATLSFSYLRTVFNISQDDAIQRILQRTLHPSRYSLTSTGIVFKQVAPACSALHFQLALDAIHDAATQIAYQHELLHTRKSRKN